MALPIYQHEAFMSYGHFMSLFENSPVDLTHVDTRAWFDSFIWSECMRKHLVSSSGRVAASLGEGDPADSAD